LNQFSKSRDRLETLFGTKKGDLLPVNQQSAEKLKAEVKFSDKYQIANKQHHSKIE
jgi:hypothetical protein